MLTGNYKSRHAKVSYWWKRRDAYLAVYSDGHRSGNVAGHLQGGRKRYNFKAIPGRGRKQSLWVSALYHDLRAEFDVFDLQVSR